MSEIEKPYNEYAAMNYRLAYSTNTTKRVKAKSDYFVVKYKNETLTNPTNYALAQVSIKEFRMMSQFTNKELLTIKPYKK